MNGIGNEQGGVSRIGAVAPSHANVGQAGQNRTSGTSPFVNQVLNSPPWDKLGQFKTKNANF